MGGALAWIRLVIHESCDCSSKPRANHQTADYPPKGDAVSIAVKPEHPGAFAQQGKSSIDQADRKRASIVDHRGCGRRKNRGLHDVEEGPGMDASPGCEQSR